MIDEIMRLPKVGTPFHDNHRTIVGFAFVRTYRILDTGYRTGAGLFDLEDSPGER